MNIHAKFGSEAQKKVTVPQTFLYTGLDIFVGCIVYYSL